MNEMVARSRIGKKPENGALIAEHGDWQMFDTTRQDGSVLLVKVISKFPVIGSANYFLTWDKRERRFWCSKEAKRLDAQQPDVLAWVVDVMKGIK